MRRVVLSYPLPDTNYTVEAEFDYNTGGWWITDKTTSSFILHITNANSDDRNFIVHIYR
ncbi:MAG: hypothetical protein QXS18_04915 [Thermoplasmata archaeon]